MVEPDIYEALTPILRRVFGQADLVAHPTLTARDVIGWDSFKHVELILEVEEAFVIRVRLREQSDLRSLADLAALILSKRQGGTT